VTTKLKKGVSAFKAGDIRRSAALIADTLKTDPFDWEANYYAGLHAMSQRDHALGSDLLRNAAALLDSKGHYHSGVWYNLGAALMAQARLEEAAYAYSRCIQVKPNAVLALAALASIHYQLGDPVGGSALHDRALSIKWGEPDEQWAQSLILLLRGDYEQGWRLYESRWKVMSFQHEQGRKRLGLPTPRTRWHGEQLDGDMILVHTEQGVGDAIMGLRYVQAVKERGGRVVLEVHEQLASWVREHAEAIGADIVLARGEPIPEACKTYVPILSIPAATPPWREPPGIRSLWRVVGLQGRRSVGRSLRVGLCWHGAKGHLNDYDRSAPFRELLPLFGVPNIEWHALTLDEDRLSEMEKALPGWVRPKRLAASDYRDTANVMRGLDLVISVDTGAAHLGGALGVPVWVMLPASPEWRWGLEGSTTDLYPSMTLYRKQKWNDWRPVVEAVKADLLTLAEGR
jgi:tetratricopeptide (TPR) repeat protein